MGTSHSSSHLDLPAEILSIIFFAFVASSTNSLEALDTLKGVCDYWDAIVQNDPALWSTFILDCSGERWVNDEGVTFSPRERLYDPAADFFADPAVHKASSIVLRSPYNDRLKDFMYTPDEPEIFEGVYGLEGWLAPQVISGICRAEFLLDPVQASNIFVALPFDLPTRNTLSHWNKLTTLKLIATHGQRMPEELVDFVREEGQLAASMPSLVDLELAAHDLELWSEWIPWQQLRRLKLRVEEVFMEDFLEIFCRCHRTLEECDFRLVTLLDPDREHPDSPVPVSFSALKIFAMHVLSGLLLDDDEISLPVSPLNRPFHSALPDVIHIDSIHHWGTTRLFLQIHRIPSRGLLLARFCRRDHPPQWPRLRSVSPALRQPSRATPCLYQPRRSPGISKRRPNVPRSRKRTIL